MEVSYFPCGGSITDYVCEVFGQRLGVSVTRAMKYKGDYSEEDALHLLCKKLKGKINYGYIIFPDDINQIKRAKQNKSPTEISANVNP